MGKKKQNRYLWWNPSEWYICLHTKTPEFFTNTVVLWWLGDCWPTGFKTGCSQSSCSVFCPQICHQKLPLPWWLFYLVALFHTEDLRKYGFDPILELRINDIKRLELRPWFAFFCWKSAWHSMPDNRGRLWYANKSGIYRRVQWMFFFFRLFDWKKIFTMRITPR